MVEKEGGEARVTSVAKKKIGKAGIIRMAGIEIDEARKKSMTEKEGGEEWKTHMAEN